MPSFRERIAEVVRQVADEHPDETISECGPDIITEMTHEFSEYCLDDEVLDGLKHLSEEDRRKLGYQSDDPELPGYLSPTEYRTDWQAATPPCPKSAAITDSLPWMARLRRWLSGSATTKNTG